MRVRKDAWVAGWRVASGGGNTGTAATMAVVQFVVTAETALRQGTPLRVKPAPQVPLLGFLPRQRLERRQHHPLRSTARLDRLQPAVANPVIHRPPRHAEQRRG